MRVFLMIAATLLAVAAQADQEPELRTDRAGVKVTAIDKDEDTDAKVAGAADKAAAKHNTMRSNRTGTKAAPARDSGSSRSSSTSAAEPAPEGSHNASRSNRSRATSESPSQDYNSSRSNNGSAGVALHDDDDDGDGVDDASRAQNHNSSRSNRTQPACRAGAGDDCDDTDRAPTPANGNRR